MTEPRSINYIDFELMKKMCHPIAVALFDSTVEPMTKFDEHERALLESSLGNPRQTFGGKELYPLIAEKAAILYYTLIKNHPFKNGNKRTATASLLVFLHINDLWLREGITESNENYLVDLARRVSSSIGNESQSSFLKEITFWLDQHIV